MIAFDVTKKLMVDLREPSGNDFCPVSQITPISTELTYNVIVCVKVAAVKQLVDVCQPDLP
jgi:hypothetical protein